jgi:hypothetical protein
MQDAPHSRSDIFLSIRPNPLGGLVVTLLAWGISTFAGALLFFTAEKPNLTVISILVTPFAFIITYYGLIKGLFQGAGAIHVSKEGFSLCRGKADTPYYPWDSVQDFFIGKFARSPVHDGIDAPHMHVLSADGKVRVEWLPGNTGLTPHYLVEVMEYLRQLHREGWPTTPTRLPEIYAALKARDRTTSAIEK